MIKAQELLHKKSNKKYTALCGKITLYTTEVEWRVTCEECKSILVKNSNPQPDPYLHLPQLPVYEL